MGRPWSCSESDNEPVMFGEYWSDNRRTSGLCRAFFVFFVINVMFVSYFVVDHRMERSKLDESVARLEEKLERLKQETVLQQDNTEISQKIVNTITQKRSCDVTYGIMNLLGDKLEVWESERNNFDIWNQVPREFLHLVGKNIQTVENRDKAFKGLRTVVGWSVTGGGQCFDIDPKLKDESDIIIEKDGNYSVYSQLTFYTKKGDALIIHRHVVQYVEVAGSTHAPPKILMESAYQLPGETSKISYQSGVYRLTKGDILRVLVQKAPRTNLYKSKNEGVQASFGVVIL